MTSSSTTQPKAGFEKPKNIVICSDGTGNKDIKDRGTNVFKIYEAVDIQGHKANSSLTPQIAFYDDGVGTKTELASRFLGQAFGLGFTRNIKELYTNIIRVYNRGDNIFLFGFSRGAYTVRALSGLITRFGILDRNKLPTTSLIKDAIETIWKEFHYRAFVEKNKNKRDSPIPENIAELLVSDSKKIHFIGVWDTVGAVGMPFDGLTEKLNDFFPRQFVDFKPSLQIERACHALSIDDERKTFKPVLWDESGVDTNTISQVWFAGVHANVGGGYPKQGMSLVSLDWMMSEAECFDLRFIKEAREFVRNQQDVHDKLYDSRAGLAVYYRWEPRNIYDICKERNTVPKIHVSVLERIGYGTYGYAPGNIPFECTIVTNNNKYGYEWPSVDALVNASRCIKESDTESCHYKSPLDKANGIIEHGKSSYISFLFLTIVTIFISTPTIIKIFSKNYISQDDPLINCIKQLFADTHTKCAYLACSETNNQYILFIYITLAFFAAFSFIIWRWSISIDSSLETIFSSYWKPLRGKIIRCLYEMHDPENPPCKEPLSKQ